MDKSYTHQSGSIIEHTLEVHKQSLDELCRICFGRAQSFADRNKKKKPFMCINYADEIKLQSGLDITKDLPTAHPAKLCRKCYNLLKRSSKNNVAAATFKLQTHENNEHYIDNDFRHASSIDVCHTCSVYHNQKTGGVVTSRTRNMPTVATLEYNLDTPNIFGHLINDLTEVDTSYLIPVGLTENQQQNETCQICKCLFSPQALYIKSCDHMFCASCLDRLFRSKLQNTVECPSCRSTVHFKDVDRINRQLLLRILDLHVQCTKCGHASCLSMMGQHICATPIEVPAVTPQMGPNGCITSLRSPNVQLTPQMGPNGCITSLRSPNVQLTPKMGPNGCITSLGSTNVQLTPKMGPNGYITSLGSSNVQLTPHMGPSGYVTSHRSPHVQHIPQMGPNGYVSSLKSPHFQLTPQIDRTVSSLRSNHDELTPKRGDCQLSARNLSQEYVPQGSLQIGPIADHQQPTKNQDRHLNELDENAVFQKAINCIRNKPADQPLGPLQEKLLTYAAEHKLQNNEVLVLKKHGQNTHLMKISKPRKPSSEVKIETLKKRSRNLEGVRKVVSGEDDTTKQFASELSRLPVDQRVEVCARAGIRRGSYITSDLALVMKTYTNMTWNGFRKMKQILKSVGIVSESEHSMRECKRSLVGKHFHSDLVNFEVRNESSPHAVNGMILSPAPCVYVRDLPNMIIEVLARYEVCNTLYWHEGIPAQEIWIKIGGDKGQGSFKMAFQIVNVKDSNSPLNTVVFNCFEASDTYLNLTIGLNDLDKDIKMIEGSEWQGKNKKCFISTDYELACKFCGIAGANGKYPCIFCLINRDKMQEPREKRSQSRPRTSSQLQRDYKKFVKEGGRDKKNQSAFHNVINPPIITCLEPERFNLPSLHIKLGLVKKHHDLMLADCHQIDLQIALEMAGNKSVNENGSSKFDCHTKALQQIKVIEEKLVNIDTEIEDLNLDLDSLSLAQLGRNSQKVKMLQKQKDKLQYSLEEEKRSVGLDIGEGPVTASLDTELQANNIKRQAYHGNCFVGNHCDKYLQTKVYESLSARIVTETAKHTDSSDIIKFASSIANKFNTLNGHLAVVYRCLSNDAPQSEEEMKRTQSRINSYMKFYRQSFPMIRTTLKHHLLEDHAVEWIKRNNIGLNIMSEQGMESIHRNMREISDTMSGIRNAKSRLLSTVEEHFIRTTPEVRKQYPQVKKRKI